MRHRILEKEPITDYEHLYGDVHEPISVCVFSDPLPIYSYPDVPHVVSIVTVYEHFQVQDYSQEDLVEKYLHVNEEGVEEALDFIEENGEELRGADWDVIGNVLGHSALDK
jgi:hypothetical protein